MSSKSQVNKMSKKELLESLSYQQYQDTAMLNRFFIALARTANVSPEDLAKSFVDQAGNAEFASKLNAAIDALAVSAKTEPAETPQGDITTIEASAQE